MKGALYTTIPDQRNSIDPWSSFSRKEAHDNFDLFAERHYAALANAIISIWLYASGTATDSYLNRQNDSSAEIRMAMN